MDLRHFAFYAFAGRSGMLRWDRKNEARYFLTTIYTLCNLFQGCCRSFLILLLKSSCMLSWYYMGLVTLAVFGFSLYISRVIILKVSLNWVVES